MNQVVLQSVAQLTQTELVAFGESGNVLHRTIETPPGTLDAQQIVVSKQGTEQRYVAFRFATVRGPARSDGVCDVLVLFDEKSLTEKRNRAALLPLVTGGSTILALSSITLLLTSKLIRRIAGLQQRVESVAAGDFQTVPQDAVSDEVGQLSGAVDNMAGQLDQLWNEVNRQQSEKLLHQIAGGMAHQLRNSLTGARMAVELHQQECRTDDHGLNIAIDQIELSEDYVRRLLLAASGRQDADHPMGARQCCESVRSSLDPVAKHLRIDAVWQVDDAISGWTISDGPGFIAAVTNLVHNAMQAGKQVHVQCILLRKGCVRHEASALDQNRLQVQVRDNGPGIDDDLAADVFEPFVTSKPEGMGLGLSVVRRAAERLEGSVDWRRDQDWTVFEFVVPVSRIS